MSLSPMPGSTRYRNPVIAADYSDPDVIRVGDTYWMTASTFNRVPGLPLLRSRDLVTWEHVTNVLPRLVPHEHYRLPRRGCGVWAPSIRHHDGTFYIVFPDPDYGIWVTSAQDPEGEWSEPWLLLPGTGRIDPCPFWDEDGRTFLVYGWAASRCGFKNRLTMVEVSGDLRAVVGKERTIIEGDRIPGCVTLEGPKMFQRDGVYWIFAPAGGVEDGWQYAFQAADAHGPYEHRIVLAQGETDINGPHQGAWVETPEGSSWFVHFQDRGAYGRTVLLEPMEWGEDGWPTMGTPGLFGIGAPVREHPVPCGSGTSQGVPLPYSEAQAATILDAGGSLASHWYWQANPEPTWLEPFDGRARLVPTGADRGDLRAIPNVLAQRVPDCPALFAVRLHGSGPGRSGTRGGLVVLGEEYAWLGLEVHEGQWRVAGRSRGTTGADEADLFPPVEIEVPNLDVEVRVARGVVELRWRPVSSGAEADEPLWQGPYVLPLVAGSWVGADIGLFTTRLVGCADDGTVLDVEMLRVELGR